MIKIRSFPSSPLRWFQLPVVRAKRPLHDSADHIGSFYLWNAAGCGFANEEQHATWSQPVRRVEGASDDAAPSGWKRF